MEWGQMNIVNPGDNMWIRYLVVMQLPGYEWKKKNETNFGVCDGGVHY